MAPAMTVSVVISDQYNLNKRDLSVLGCLNCESLEKQPHSALEELESAKLIIKLLQKEIDDFPTRRQD
jgi:hypothetical protein